MGYRTLDKKPKPEDFHPRFVVRNGATLRIVLGCYYGAHGHDPHYHDFINWPAPNYHPGGVCQMKPPRDLLRWSDGKLYNHPVRLDPIHLDDEGYDDAWIFFENEDLNEYLEGYVTYDQDTDNYIRITVNTLIPTFTDEPKETEFTVYIRRSDPDTEMNVVDAVFHGIIKILPGGNEFPI